MSSMDISGEFIDKTLTKIPFSFVDCLMNKIYLQLQNFFPDDLVFYFIKSDCFNIFSKELCEFCVVDWKSEQNQSSIKPF